MKILLLNTSEKNGGAAIACNRLLHALNKNGTEANMLVLNKQTDDPHVYSVNTGSFKRGINTFRFLWERLVIFMYNKFSKENLFKVSIANTGNDISHHPLVKDADIIHLHWINQGFLSLKNIEALTKLGKPIVWTMHDMWPCTGICHHAFSCVNFHQFCGHCFFMQSNKKKDLSFRIFFLKKNVFNCNITWIPVSNWLNNQLHYSSIIMEPNSLVIPNTIDINLFMPKDKFESRKRLGLPTDKKIIVMGAAKLNDKIKGFSFLCQALNRINMKDNYLLILFGIIKNDSHFFDNLNFPYRFLGSIKQEMLPQLYSAADVTISASLYETFGQTIAESMSCETPVVSFNNSGQTDIIDHKQNGYLADYLNAEDLATGIQWVLNNPDYESLCKNARQKVLDNYSEEKVAQQYLDVYNTLAKNSCE